MNSKLLKYPPSTWDMISFWNPKEMRNVLFSAPLCWCFLLRITVKYLAYETVCFSSQFSLSTFYTKDSLALVSLKIRTVWIQCYTFSVRITNIPQEHSVLSVFLIKQNNREDGLLLLPCESLGYNDFTASQFTFLSFEIIFLYPQVKLKETVNAKALIAIFFSALLSLKLKDKQLKNTFFGSHLLYLMTVYCNSDIIKGIQSNTALYFMKHGEIVVLGLHQLVHDRV